ncbi:hypothetical protein C6I20_08270 [Aeromicrobium sp. A1-2]|uniref:Lsr2 family protein n=1 Tax=Aeromicrobium sp. A1-2 TaxID=2107713 RepID=UPI000E47DA3D|nr:Lsr2 family protein [Aeromicrobium sp. A1-2]AXT85182.1 hypothetical protein C6I20_08270 [Aeromicrobium sp. A1-2]
MARRVQIIEKAEIFDDFDGALLDPETRSQRYQLNGKTYDLYLSAASKATVDAFIADLVDGAEEVKGQRQARATKGTSLGVDEKKRRVEAYNTANPDNTYTRYTAHVQSWWAANGR